MPEQHDTGKGVITQVFYNYYIYTYLILMDKSVEALKQEMSDGITV